MGNNKVANILKGYAIFNAVVGCIGGLVVAATMDNMLLFLIVAAAIAVVSFGIYAFGEVIQLLQDIKVNTMATAMKGTGKAVEQLGSKMSNNEIPEI